MRRTLTTFCFIVLFALGCYAQNRPSFKLDSSFSKSLNLNKKFFDSLLNSNKQKTLRLNPEYAFVFPSVKYLVKSKDMPVFEPRGTHFIRIVKPDSTLKHILRIIEPDN